MKKPRYKLEDFNQYHVLKIPHLFFVIGVYLLKYPILILLPWIPMMGNASYLTGFVNRHIHWTLLIFSCVPAALMLVAGVRRTPKASVQTRWIWAHGRSLLLFALAADLVILAGLILGHRQKLSEYALIVGYLDVMFIVYVWRSQRLREVFKQFPAPQKQKTAPAA